LSEPGIGDLKFRVAFCFGDFLAQILNITRGYSQAKTYISQLISGKSCAHAWSSYSIILRLSDITVSVGSRANIEDRKLWDFCGHPTYILADVATPQMNLPQLFD
jgi:hypothetical protein